MKKQIFIFGVISIFIVSGVCSASPLMDYSKGNTSIDMTIRSGEISVNNDWAGNSLKKDVDSNFEGTITHGLGGRVAIQYRNTFGDSESYYSLSKDTKITLRSQEVNILYKLNKQISAYAGLVQVETSQVGALKTTTLSNLAQTIGNHPYQKSGYQVGLIGTTSLGPKLVGYASVGLGNCVDSYEVGLGYEVARNLEFNVGYKNAKYKGMEVRFLEVFPYDCTFKGTTLGLTYRF